MLSPEVSQTYLEPDTGGLMLPRAYQPSVPPKSAQPVDRCQPRSPETAVGGREIQRQLNNKYALATGSVECALQMIEVVWPVSPLPRDGQKILPLRTFVKSILQRSRIRQNTLLIAMYYLILIKPHIPKSGSDAKHPQSFPALQCGRRMFLAALILAHKYHEDECYSALYWSYISSLAIQEINRNEMMFLDIINWKVHLTRDIFERWTDTVTRNSPSLTPYGSPNLGISLKPDWKTLVTRLTPNMED